MMFAVIQMLLNFYYNKITVHFPRCRCVCLKSNTDRTDVHVMRKVAYLLYISALKLAVLYKVLHK